MKATSSLIISVAICSSVESFAPVKLGAVNSNIGGAIDNLKPLFATVETDAPTGFIDNELRGAAMKLHTKSQAPMEGAAPEPVSEPHVTTMDDYLRFLVDSQHVYRAFEDIILLPELSPELSALADTGLERIGPLETDIQFIVEEYDMTRPPVGQVGANYAQELQDMVAKGNGGVPEFMCHYYNHYFAHTAGGRMVGKMMADNLLNKKTLEFYKWDGNINKIKGDVKNSIEEMAAAWSREEKDLCVDATAAAFTGGGQLMAYLGGDNPRD